MSDDRRVERAEKARELYERLQGAPGLSDGVPWDTLGFDRIGLYTLAARSVEGTLLAVAQTPGHGHAARTILSLDPRTEFRAEVASMMSAEFLAGLYLGLVLHDEPGFDLYDVPDAPPE